MWKSVTAICSGALIAAISITSTMHTDKSETRPITMPVLSVQQIEAAATEPERQPNYIGDFLCTAYCPCSLCCGEYADGYTATGTRATSCRTIAVDPSIIPYGTHVAVYYDDGEYAEYIAEDCGAAIQGYHIDVFYTTHEQAQAHGNRTAQIFILGD